MPTDATPSPRQPCIHCSECARACPAGLDPEKLFFALVDEDWAVVQRGNLIACTECRRCDEVCPSHIPLLEWLCWGKAELQRQARLREHADAARARYQARNARLQREHQQRAAERAGRSPVAPDQPTVTTLGKAEVLAAIVRGRARRAARRQANDKPAAPHDVKDSP